MVRELRAEPSTQFFEPILCGVALPLPEYFIEHPDGAPLTAHARSAALSRAGPATEPVRTVVEFEEELPLPR